MKQWYCVYTKPHQADSVCRKLAELSEIELLHPRIRRKTYRGTGVVEIVEELFPSYFFTRIDLTRYFNLIRYTRGVRRFVGDSGGCPYAVEDQVVESIRSRLEDGFLSCELPHLSPGDRVHILDGPLSGLDGLFLQELKPGERVVILLNAIRYQAKVRMPRDFVARGAPGWREECVAL